MILDGETGKMIDAESLQLHGCDVNAHGEVCIHGYCLRCVKCPKCEKFKRIAAGVSVAVRDPVKFMVSAALTLAAMLLRNATLPVLEEPKRKRRKRRRKRNG